ncbi:MAG: MAE_28990/MAE_18760 family HEPN-like nuclease [Spirochaetaceae bacterium]|nr:MAE_28990/MAE_18760 family HEPN-like nuclease [Spirochaetaceae bacterium]
MRAHEELLSSRAEEIESHLSLIRELTAAAIARQGIANLQRVEMEHVDVLKSGFLVHLYNVVEAVMTKILEEVAADVIRYPPAKWSSSVRTEWVRTRAGVERGIESHQRLSRTVEIVDEAIAGAVNVAFRVRYERNWSDSEITTVSERLGCSLQVTPDVVRRACDERFQDDLAPMKYIRHKRNSLAHGNETFREGARQLGSRDLQRLRRAVVEYMESVSASFTGYLEGKSFLQENAA